MKLRNILFVIYGLSLLLWSCNEAFENPVLGESDLTIYKSGAGGNIKSEAWQGYDVIIGESMQLDLQVSPKEGTATRWVTIDENDVEELISTSMSYTFEAKEEGSQRVYFIADRGSVSDTVVANFNAILDGTYVSKINSWQTIPYEELQTGRFTYEFDMIPGQDNIDVVTGLTNVSAVTAYSDLSAIVRFYKDGTIDAFDDGSYRHDDDLSYVAGETYHVRFKVDVFKKEYDVYVTGSDGEQHTIANNYTFRNKSSNLTGMALVAGDFELENPGTHRIFNIDVTTTTQNFKPSFDEVPDILMVEGASKQIIVKATDPFGGTVSLEATGLPRYARFEELGNGEGLLSLSPYQDCTQCDVGDVTIKIVASSSNDSNTLSIGVSVIEAQVLIGDDADVDVYYGAFANDPPNPRTWRNDVLIMIGGGSNFEDPDNDIYDMAGVFPFQLPEIPEGGQFTFASLAMIVERISPWATQDYDLYGLPFRTEEFVLGSDYYQGVYDGDETATGLQQQFASQTNTVDEEIFSDANGSIAIQNYLNAQLAAGAVEGDYVFFRISVSVEDAPTFGRIGFWSVDSGTKAPYLLYDVN